jgi:MoaA/NifB/PqqE/SkfB family radical SAM enzyme
VSRRNVFVVGTSRFCNNNCIFCMEPRSRSVSEPTREVFERAAEEHQEIDFGVGEPTINPKFVDYVKMARAAGFKEISVTTNGRMLSVKKYARALAEAGVNTFKISIHGSKPAVHDALTRTPGSFRQTLAGLRNVSKLKEGYDLCIDTLTTVTKLNHRDIPGLFGLVLNYPVDWLILNVIDLTGETLRFSETLTPRYSEVDEAFSKAMELHADKIDSRGVKIAIGLPVCVLRKGLQKYFSNYERLSFDEEGKLVAAPLRRGRVFLEACNGCEAMDVCDGVWEEYVRIFGEGEFKAQKDLSDGVLRRKRA